MVGCDSILVREWILQGREIMSQYIPSLSFGHIYPGKNGIVYVNLILLLLFHVFSKHNIVILDMII